MLLETSEGGGWKERRSDLGARDRSVLSRSAGSAAAASNAELRAAKDAQRRMLRRSASTAVRQLGMEAQRNIKAISGPKARNYGSTTKSFFFLFIIRTEGGTNL